MVGFAGTAGAVARKSEVHMLQISDNAGHLIRKMTARTRHPRGRAPDRDQGGRVFRFQLHLLVGAGGPFWRFRVRGPGRREGLHRPEKPSPDRRHDARLRHQPREPRVRLQQPERQEHVRLRDVVQCVKKKLPAASPERAREAAEGGTGS